MANEMPDYLAWLRKQPCCHCGSPLLVEAHHTTNGLLYRPGERPAKSAGPKRGRGQKCHDYYAVPLCLKCHKQLHDRSGAFREMSKQRLNAWQTEQVTAHRCLWDDVQETHWLDTLPF